jgi:hypothetical protein
MPMSSPNLPYLHLLPPLQIGHSHKPDLVQLVWEEHKKELEPQWRSQTRFETISMGGT